MVKAGQSLGLKVAHEAYVDRTYDDNGIMTSRREPDAVIHDPKKAVAQVMSFVREGALVTRSGKRIPTPIHTFCTHGDEATAAPLLREVRAALAAEGVEVVKTNRGGDITYHGPGQLVGYPIVSLSAHQDLHAYLRFLEDVLINSVGTLGLVATRRPGLTGIWIGPRKVAALGVAVRRWVTYHGFALNVNAHLPHFAGIVPCGIAASDGTVTSLHVELGQTLDIAEVKAVVAREFRALWPAFLGSGDAF
jgi:lipoyl(octanoyl) transferase